MLLWAGKSSAESSGKEKASARQVSSHPLAPLLMCKEENPHSGDKVLFFPPQSPAFSKYKAHQEAASKAPELGDRSRGAQRDEEGV